MFADFIAQSQSGNTEATLALIEQFKPLLHKYVRALNYEDAYSDLVTEFIILLHNMRVNNLTNKSDGAIVSYICISMRSFYIKLSIAQRKSKTVIPFAAMNENIVYGLDNNLSQHDLYFKDDLSEIEKSLTNREFVIIKLIFMNNFTVSEAATRLHLSRQAVNQAKKRALKKLFKYYGTSC
jgi:RNA polymerase sigma factor, sigma-70 family